MLNKNSRKLVNDFIELNWSEKCISEGACVIFYKRIKNITIYIIIDDEDIQYSIVSGTELINSYKTTPEEFDVTKFSEELMEYVL